jgi:putative inorganic carbon (hco3(-)) transporter
VRDVLLTLVVFGAIPFILRRPHLGILMYVWLSVMNPHRLTWSFAHDFNFAAIVAVTTLVGAVFARKRPLPINSLSLVLLAFVGWTSVTTVFALYPSDSFELWVTMMKTQLMVLLIPLLFQTREQVRQLIWVIVLSIGYYGTKGGVFTLLTGGQYKVYGPEASYIEDNNALAVAIIMVIPLMRYLFMTNPNKYLRWALFGMMTSCGLAVLGSYSRGALLAVGAMVTFLWLKGRHKVLFLMFAVVAFPVALFYMPEQWYQRMDTIAEYQQDTSANMRLNAWGTMFNIAKDRPLFGAGYEVALKPIFDRYSPDPSFPPQVAHSIYFEALGSHGFVGFAIYVLLLITHWKHAGRLVRGAKGRADLAWLYHYGLMMQVSIVGFAVGGAFLSLVNFDVPYYLIGTTLVVGRLLEQQLRAEREGAAARGPNGRRLVSTLRLNG